MKPGTLLLEFSSVSFAYEGRPILSEMDFGLPQGACTALIGPNGIGKTTLLRIAAGLLPCTLGTVFLDRRDVKKLRRMEAARLVAMVPQQMDVPFEFTVEQIVQQGRTPHLSLFGGMGERDREAVERAIEMADVGYLRHRIFNELSGGERQRVKIALGLAQEPKLLLLDEPTQNLDMGRQMELLDLIRDLNARGVTILTAMHDLALIEGTFHSVVLLSPDRPPMQGTPGTILKPAILERAFNCPPRPFPISIEIGILKDGSI